jgi:hypothetical protein
LEKSGWIRFLTIRDLDGRTRAKRRCEELIQDLEPALGGADMLSAGQRQLVMRGALLAAMLEFESRFLLGEPIEVADYLTAVGVQRRIFVLAAGRVTRSRRSRTFRVSRRIWRGVTNSPRPRSLARCGRKRAFDRGAARAILNGEVEP